MDPTAESLSAEGKQYLFSIYQQLEGVMLLRITRQLKSEDGGRLKDLESQ